MITIEISYTTEDGELPEHYGCYDDFNSAKKCFRHNQRGNRKRGRITWVYQF